MLVFDQFEIAAGLRLSARVVRGGLHVVELDPAHVDEDLVTRCFNAPLDPTRGELWLEEVRDGTGQPIPLRTVPKSRLRGFFAQFVDSCCATAG